MLLPFGNPCDAGELSARFSADLQGSQFDNRKLKTLGTGAARGMEVTKEGLRLQVPATKDPPEVGVATRFGLRGDFEITVSYVIKRLDKPDTGYGTGACLYFETRAVTADAVTFGRVKRIKEGDIYALHVAKTNRSAGPGGKRQYDVRMFPTTAETGMLRLARSGKTLRCLVAEKGGDTFRQVRETQFTDAELKFVAIALKRQGAGTPAEVIFKDLVIRADEFPGLGASGRWFLWGTGGVLLVLAAAGGAWYWRRKTGAPAAKNAGPGTGGAP